MDPPARDTPMIAGLVHGIRVWELDWVDGDAYLQGFNDSRWEPGGAPTVAECPGWASAGERHSAPDPGCACGLYATHPHGAGIAFARLAHGRSPSLGAIAGIVAAWGRVEVHGDGFRAQYARPVALATVGAPARSDLGAALARVAERYRCELIELEHHEELVAYCRAHDLGLSRPVVRALVAGAKEPGGEAAAGLATARTPAGTAAPSPGAGRGRRGLIGAIALVLASIVWYGFLGWIGVVFVLAVIRAITEEPTPELTARHLTIAEQALVRRGDGVRYVALVRNTSPRRTAVAAFPRGRVLDRDGELAARLGPRPGVEYRPTLLPGQTGVVIDEVPGRRRRAVPEAPRFETRIAARHKTADTRAPPFVVRRTDLDPDSCRLVASLEAPAAVPGAAVALVARDGAGAISAAGVVSIGRLGAGRSRRELLPGRRAGCPRWLENVHAYRHLAPDQVLAR